MRDKVIQILWVMAAALVHLSGIAQESRTVETKVADALAQLPAADSVQYHRLMSELISFGPAGFESLTRKLVPLGEGEDSHVRYAISGLAVYCSRPGLEKAREQVESNLLNAIESVQNKEIGAYLMEHLLVAGSEQSAGKLKKYLNDNRLSDPAARVIAAAGGAEAVDILLGALPQASAENQAAIVNALGEISSEKAAGALIAFAGSDQPYLKKAATGALSRGGNPVAYDVLWNNARACGFSYDPSGAAAGFILYAQKLGENGHLQLCRKACRDIMKANKAPGKYHNYAAAAGIYTEVFRSEATPLLLKAIDIDNKELRAAVLHYASDIEGEEITRKWIVKARKSDPDVQADIIRMVGSRSDPAAWEFVKGSLQSEFKEPRIAAIAALVQLSGDKACPVLLDHLIKGNDLEEAKASLLTMTSRKNLVPVAEALDHSHGDVRAALVEILAAKSGTAWFDKVFRLTSSADPAESTAAFAALKDVASPGDLDLLVKLLLSVTGKEKVKAVQEAVVAAASGVENEQEQTAKILTALKETQNKKPVIEILPEVGGAAALEAAIACFNETQGETRDAALEALAAWKDYSAAPFLLGICETHSGEYRSKALKGFLAQTRNAALPDDQKLLQLRKLMPLASNNEERTGIIQAVGDLQTFTALVYAGQYLDEPLMKQAAAGAVANIALPRQRDGVGFTGEITKKLLEKVLNTLEGTDSDYEKVRIRRYLAGMPDEEGFVAMFNGKNLEGWKGFVASPPERMKMSEEELAKKQVEANKSMPDKWKIKDGVIAFSGEGYEGNNLVYHREFKNFEMLVDWRISKMGDSGIYLRGSPQVQIWDITRFREGSGGLFNNQVHPSKPLAPADNPVGEWNTFRITMVGDRVTVYLNGVLVVDNVVLENYWNRDEPIYPVETIELQAHGSDIRFRDLYIREIEDEQPGMSEEEKQAGFSSLFNGVDLEGWFGDIASHRIVNGVISVEPQEGKAGNLYTVGEYADFIFRFEFQLTPAANNGLGIRVKIDDEGRFTGTELQILDDTSPVYSDIEAYQYHGSVYGLIPARKGFLKPLGEWNQQEVLVQGDDVKITLNGEVIVQGNMKEALEKGAPDQRPHPGVSVRKGHVAFLGHDSPLKFRNIRIKEL